MRLAERALRGSAYVVASSYLLDVVGFAGSVVMARLLDPVHYGILALAAFFLDLLARLRLFGFIDQFEAHTVHPAATHRIHPHQQMG